MNIMSPEVPDSKLSKLPGGHPDVKAGLKRELAPIVATPQPASMSRPAASTSGPARPAAPAPPSPTPSPPPSSQAPSRSIHSHDHSRDRSYSDHSSTYGRPVASSHESADDISSNKLHSVPSAAPPPPPEYRHSGAPSAGLHPEYRDSAPPAAPSPHPEYHSGYGVHRGYGSQDTHRGYDTQGAHRGYGAQGAQGRHPGYNHVEERYNGHHMPEREQYSYAAGSSGHLTGPASRGYNDPFDHRFQPYPSASHLPPIRGPSYPDHDHHHYNGGSHHSHYLQALPPPHHRVPYSPSILTRLRMHPDDPAVSNRASSVSPEAGPSRVDKF